ncbi:MAG: oligosaccharide flippase family protein [Phycisphaerae bacterium]|nr:oligosaccharide flippase family protein [Phycisphaerae bacterium]
MPALGRAAKIGSAWALLQSFSSKLASLAAQVLLARLLLPAEMGLAGKALSVHGLFLFFNPAIMGDVLIQRKATLDRDARPAFWIVLALSLVTGAAILASGPIFATWYGDSVMIGLLAVLALRPLGLALQAVPTARLRLGFRFGAISSWSIWMAVGTAALTVLLAWFGWGPYAITVPAVALLFVMAAAYQRLAPTGVGLTPSFIGGKPILREWTTLCSGQYAHTVSLYVDYLILGFFATDAEVGFYFFAFNLSGQLNGIIVYNISLVLQPVFAMLRDDPVRQVRAFLRAVSTISAVSMPLCLVQAALAEPGLRLIFGERWMPAATMLTLLSVAQAFAFPIGPTTALLKSQQRFRAYFVWQAIQTALMIPTIAIAAWWGTRDGSATNTAGNLVACVILVQFMLSAPLGLWYAIRVGEGTFRDAMRPFTRPFLASVVVIAPLWWASWALPTTIAWDVARLGVIPLVTLLVYPFALRFVDRDVYDTLRENLGSAFRRLGRSKRRTSL